MEWMYYLLYMFATIYSLIKHSNEGTEGSIYEPSNEDYASFEYNSYDVFETLLRAIEVVVSFLTGVTVSSVDARDTQIEDVEKPKSPSYEDKYLEIVRKMKANLEMVEKSEDFYKSLKNCQVIEYTPVGNVLMTYKDNKFAYYSDHNVPYRYLEVVCRKFVKTFNCVELYVDMEEELKKCEEKLKIEKENVKREQEQQAQSQHANKSRSSVFAKFKNYNKDLMSAVKSSATIPPAKTNSIQIVTPKIEKLENSIQVLKENANRYTYEGKMMNFMFMPKIEKSTFNKKLKMTFAEYRKMQEQQNSKTETTTTSS